jgi:hypothetical protein
MLTAQSQSIFRLQTCAVGEGADQFFTLPLTIMPTGEIVGAVAGHLRHRSDGQTLLVLPEGEMLNYLARMPSPLPLVQYFSDATEDGREEHLLEMLKQRPPDWVVIISRDLREYGIKRYGERPGEGQLLLQWVTENYRGEGTIGGDPLDVQQFGAVIFQRDRLKLPDSPPGQR